MLKKILVLSVLLFVFGVHCFAQPVLYINDEECDFENSLFIENGRTMLPMREVFEILGAEVEWIETENIILASRGEIIITLKPGNSKLLKTNADTGITMSVLLDVSPSIVNDRAYVPLRAIAESFGALVNWDSWTERIDIVIK